MSPLLIAYGWLFLAIILEVTGTSSLQASQQFTRWLPSLVTVVAYVGAFYFLSLSLRAIPLGVAYAVWGGIGMVFVSAIGVWIYRQPLDLPAILGISLIVLGVVILNAFSRSVTH